MERLSEEGMFTDRTLRNKKIGLLLRVAGIIVAFGIAILALISTIYPQLLLLPIFRQSSPSDRVLIILEFGLMTEALLFIYHSFSTKVQEALAFLKRANTPSFEAKNDRESDDSLVDYYKEQAGKGGFVSAIGRNVPVYPILPAGLWNVAVETDKEPYREWKLRLFSNIQRNSARRGLDYFEFVKWLTADLKDRYGNWWTRKLYDQKARLAGELKIDSENDHNITIPIAKCKYIDYLLTEYASSYVISNLNLRFREVLEARIGSDGKKSRPQLDNISDSKSLYPLVMSVNVLLTTTENDSIKSYVIFQRRSEHVKEGSGRVGSAAEGGTEWKRDRVYPSHVVRFPGGKGINLSWVYGWPHGSSSFSILKAAANETFEELGISWKEIELEKENLAPVVMGAGFNLLHGRDLNFYVHLHTRLSWIDLASRKARDSWERDHLIPIEFEEVYKGINLKEQNMERNPLLSVLYSKGNRGLVASLHYFYTSRRCESVYNQLFKKSA